MTPQEKLWMHAVLQAIADQDPRYATKEWGQQNTQSVAKEAQAFVKSSDFDAMCYAANIRPEFARRIPPEKAALALARLNDIKVTRLETTEAIEKEIKKLGGKEWPFSSQS